MSRPRPFRSEAIVLRQRSIGEADKVCVLLTPSLGRIEASARGARKPGSRLGGHIHPFSRVQFELAHGRSMYVVASAQTLDSWHTLHDDVDRLAQAAAIAELVDRTSEAGAGAAVLYSLLRHTLAELAQTDAPAAVRRWFCLRWLDQSGYRPELDDCVRCRAKLGPEGAGFSADEGGVVCPDCLRAGLGAPLSSGAFKLLRYMRRSSCADAARVQVRPSTESELERHLRAALEQSLDGRLRSTAFVHTLERAVDTARRAAEGEIRHAAV